MTERNDFEIETTSYIYTTKDDSIDLELNRRVAEKLTINPMGGICAADPNGIVTNRIRDWHLTNVIGPMIKRGEIDDGTKTPFDDRKLRYDGSFMFEDSSELSAGFGVTHFKAFQADLNRSDDENFTLQERGRQEMGERWAYFSRAPGVAVLPINQDGTIFIGERANAEFGGFLNAVAGHLTYKNNVYEISIIDDCYKELKEEFGIQSGEISNLRLVGLYSHRAQGHLDFTFLADVAKPESYFTSGEWKRSVREREHKDLVRLATMDEIQELLGSGKVPGSDRTLEVMYSTRGALMSVNANEIRN